MRIQVALVAIAVASGATLLASEAYACDDQKEKSSASNEYDHARASDLQRALRDAGYYEGAIDGTLDRDVRQALIRFQNDKGFVPTGRIDPRTRRALKIDGVETDEIRRVRGVDGAGNVDDVDVGDQIEFERPWERTPFELKDPKTLTPNADPVRIPMPEPEEPELDLQSGDDLLDDAARNEAMKDAMKDARRAPGPIDDTTPVTGGATEVEPTEEETSDEGANGD